jgi:serine/threonine protein kinase
VSDEITPAPDEGAAVPAAKPSRPRTRPSQPRARRAGAAAASSGTPDQDDSTVPPEGKPARPRPTSSRPKTTSAQRQAGPAQPKAGPVQPKAGPVQAKAGPAQAKAGPGQAKTGPAPPKAGPGQAKTGAVPPKAGPAQPKAGAAQRKAASPRSKTGAAQRKAASPRPKTGAAQREAGSARPKTEVSAGPASQIAGYRLEEQIGQGGMAVVYRARDERLDRRVALKLLVPALAMDAAFRQRFIRESRAAAAVDHPNIIPIYEAGEAGGSLFIAMRYVQGGDVKSLLERRGPLPAWRAWSIISQVAAALDAAHAHGLVHRDVKPANMLLDTTGAAAGQGRVLPDDRPEHVYLSDFGISKQSLAASNLTMSGQFVGTLDYIAPEQIDGHNVDGRADQYSLACAAYELLSGTPPFRREQGLAMITAHLAEPPPSLAARRDDLPAAVDRVLASAMAKSPDGRYATCAQFATDLGRSLGLVAGAPEPPGMPPQAGLGAGGRAGPAAGLGGLAGGIPGPEARPAQHLTPGGPRNVRSTQDRPGAPPPAGYQQGAGLTRGPRPTAIYGGPPGDAGGAWPPGPGEPGWEQPPPARRSRGKIAAVAIAAAAIAAAAVAIVLVSHRSPPTVHGVAVSGSSSASSSPSSSPSPSSSRPSSSPASLPSSPASLPSSSSAASSSSSPASTAQSSPSVHAPSASAEATAVSKVLASGDNSASRLNTAADNVKACTDVAAGVQQIQRVRDQRQTEYEQAQTLQTGALSNGAELKSDLTQALSVSLSADNDYLTWAQQQQPDCQAGTAPPGIGAANSQADNDKASFIGLWNPIAEQYGLQRETQASM